MSLNASLSLLHFAGGGQQTVENVGLYLQKPSWSFLYGWYLLTGFLRGWGGEGSVFIKDSLDTEG